MPPIPTGAPGPGPLTVLVLSADPAHAASVSATVQGWPLQACVVAGCAAHEGIGLALLRQPWLVVIDADVDGLGGWALARQLLRVRPLIDVLVFDRLGAQDSRGTGRVRPWAELPQVLEHRLRRQLDGARDAAWHGSRP